MLREWAYAIRLNREVEEIHAYCADLPEAIAAGATDADATREMSQAILAAVRGRIKDGMDLGQPRAPEGDQIRLALPPQLAAKAAIYSAWRESGLSKVALGDRIGRSESEVRRILDPDYGTKLDQLAEAASALGGRLAISFATG